MGRPMPKSALVLGSPALAFTAYGQTLSVDGRYLRNTSPDLLLVDEIRFQIATTTTTPANGAWGHLFAASIALGSYKLTSGFVPLKCFCRLVDRTYKLIDFGYMLEPTSFVFRLYKPLMLDPGEAISIQLQYLNPGLVSGAGTDSRVPYSVTVSAVGRVMGKDYVRGPQHLPFLASYSTPWQAPSAVAAVPQIYASGPGDLFNPSPSPLMVKEFLGYGFWHRAPWWIDMTDYILASAMDLGISGTQVQIVNAGPLLRPEQGPTAGGIRDFVPFFHAFMPQTRAWNVNALLAPQSYFQLTFKAQNWATINTNAGLSADIVRFSVGMVGYYKL